WNPLTPEPDVRTETIIKASYRGVQDARTCIRNLHRSVEEDGNPYGVDLDRIVLWGQGTGGYLSLGAATLDDYSEISSLDKFLNTTTFLPYVTQELDGDIYGEVAAPLNTPNHVGYPSEFHLAVNMGGALGDTSWVDNVNADFNAPPIMGYHVLTDPFAPISDGVVREPVNNEVVVRVSGTVSVVEKANAKGINVPLDPALDDENPLGQFLNARVEALSNVTIDLSALGQGVTPIAATHMYTFVPPIDPDTGGPRLESGPWDWWNKDQLDATLAGTPFDSDQLDSDGKLTNPDMSPEKARAHIDTIFAHFLPRACQVLQLGECAIVNTEELIDDSLHGLSVAPNPAVDRILVQTNPSHPMEAIQVFDMNGRFVRSHFGIDNHQYHIERGDLPNGIYLLKVKFAEGISIRRIVFN
ncbi:MAG: T9SS type A sorting domain-containing protein, partial [Bacteroidota bacterium]